jgi:hypothetical protein
MLLILRRRYLFANSGVVCLGRVMSSVVADSLFALELGSFEVWPRYEEYADSEGELFECAGLLYKCPTVAMPEPDGRADPPCNDAFVIDTPAVSARRCIRRYRSGEDLATFAEGKVDKEPRSIADCGRCANCLDACDNIEASLLELACGGSVCGLDGSRGVLPAG